LIIQNCWNVTIFVWPTTSLALILQVEHFKRATDQFLVELTSLNDCMAIFWVFKMSLIYILYIIDCLDRVINKLLIYILVSTIHLIYRFRVNVTCLLHSVRLKSLVSFLLVLMDQFDSCGVRCFRLR
jgi:hypothetical protein